MAAYLNTPDLGTKTPTNVDDVYDLALQYGRILVGGPNIQTHYDVFDKDFLQFGAMIADYKIIPNASEEVNPNSATFKAPKYNEILKLYFGDWHDRSYETSVRDAEAHAVVNGETALDVFISQIINSINEQERLEKYQNYQQVFNSLMTLPDSSGIVTPEGELVDLNQYETLTFGSEYLTANGGFNSQAYALLFEEIRNVVMGMTFPSGENSGGYVSAANIDDIYICAPYEFWNGGGVLWLSRVFNLSETQALGHIVETNCGHFKKGGISGDSANYGNIIWILHKNAIGRCIRYENSMEQFVRQSWSRWYGREVVDLYYFNKYEKAFGIFMEADPAQ